MFPFFFFSSRRRHTRFDCDWSSDVCSSDLEGGGRDRGRAPARHHHGREQLRVRHRDRRRPREDLRPGRDHVDARRRDRVFVAAAQDPRGPDPDGGPEVLRRRQLRSGALPPSSVSIMRRSIRSTAAVVIAVLVAAMICRDAPAIAAEDVTRERLDNGVTVLVRENPLAPVVAVALLVRMGTRWERAENAGISNFVHAVMVKGTARRSGADPAEAVAGLGGKLIAAGEVDYSGIQASAPARVWRELLGVTAEGALTDRKSKR